MGHPCRGWYMHTLYVYTCICIHVCACIHIYTCICIHVYAYIHTYIHIHPIHRYNRICIQMCFSHLIVVEGVFVLVVFFQVLLCASDLDFSLFTHSDRQADRRRVFFFFFLPSFFPAVFLSPPMVTKAPQLPWRITIITAQMR